MGQEGSGGMVTLLRGITLPGLLCSTQEDYPIDSNKDSRQHSEQKYLKRSIWYSARIYFLVERECRQNIFIRKDNSNCCIQGVAEQHGTRPLPGFLPYQKNTAADRKQQDGKDVYPGSIDVICFIYMCISRQHEKNPAAAQQRGKEAQCISLSLCHPQGEVQGV